MRVSHPALLIFIVKQSDACKAEITLPLSEFPERPASAARPERQMQLGNNLIALADRHQRPGEEVAGAYHPRSVYASKRDFPLAGHSEARQFGGRVGMSKAAADGAAVTDLIMCDVRDCLPQQRVRCLQPPIVLDIAPAHPGAQSNAVIANRNRIQPRNPTQVYEQAG